MKITNNTRNTFVLPLKICNIDVKDLNIDEDKDSVRDARSYQSNIIKICKSPHNRSKMILFGGATLEVDKKCLITVLKDPNHPITRLVHCKDLTIDASDDHIKEIQYNEKNLPAVAPDLLPADFYDDPRNIKSANEENKKIIAGKRTRKKRSDQGAKIEAANSNAKAETIEKIMSDAQNIINE